MSLFFLDKGAGCAWWAQLSCVCADDNEGGWEQPVVVTLQSERTEKQTCHGGFADI